MSSVPSSPPRLVFTDLDGTLLDHDSYEWQPAAPWLERLRHVGVTVIPVTSKTRAELMPLRQELGLRDTPFIAENGAVIGLPQAWQHARLDRDPTHVDGLAIKTPGIDIGFLRTRLGVLRDRLGVRFRGMGEMPIDDIIALTGLSEHRARLARVREGCEPLIWDDSEAALADFRQALEADGLCLMRGGRFWHAMGRLDKGDGVRWLVERYRALRGRLPETLGLGDGPNDVPLLEAVDRAVLIPGHHGHTISLTNPHQYLALRAGPSGWAEGIDHWWGDELPTLSNDEESRG
ncbi:HAD-IIB family hydrolase [Halomonas sp. YLGW01]|uniref:HAD-IIB family hydrolase n=1 Tax=Halomonas sp. YLGW01 TaxID=2773308 RepID=UPI0017852166|nr:HAD-IIB family hydrolase [Halomonas sp. YLGW01]